MNLRMDKRLADFLREVRHTTPDQKVYLVGGAVRDLVLGRGVKDLDFVVADGSVRLAKAVRRRFDGVWYSLDDEHQTARVILEQGQPDELVLDFTSFIGGSLEEDLRQRDFTINAMAIDLDNLKVVIDPLGGQEDLKKGRLRLGNPNSMLSDPLRALRAVRMTRAFDLDLTLEIYEQLRVASTYLNRISGERIRDELLKCLAIPDLTETYGLLRDFGILYELQHRVFPQQVVQGELDNSTDESISLDRWSWENAYETHLEITNHESDIISHRLSALEQLMQVVEGRKTDPQLLVEMEQRFGSTDIQSHLKQLFDESLQAGRTRKELLILLSLFFKHEPVFESCNKKHMELKCLEFAENITNTFMLGQKEQKFFELVCVGYEKIMSLHQKDDVTPLQLYRYFKEVGSFGLESAILHKIEQQISPSPNEKLIFLADEIIRAWFLEYQVIVDPPRLIDGIFLQKSFHLSPGPELGYYLETIREAQVVGKVKNLEEAQALVMRMMKEGKSDVR